jgi:ABC-type sugar transport system substrate-binding protein/AraC-like DNA-binding protein
MVTPREGRVLLWDENRKAIPPRPKDPAALPEADEGHWYDLEYAGWGVEKRNLPVSPADGAAGKRVICLQPAGKDHPYWPSYGDGMKAVAEASGVNLVQRFTSYHVEDQRRVVRHAIRDRPDLIIFVPDQTDTSTKLVQEIHGAGIPIIASNLLPPDDAFPYLLAWTGPDDWGQARLLARKFSELMAGRGGYCIVQHYPGTSSFLARTWGVITELRKVAPAMELLDTKATYFDVEATAETVVGWIRRFGRNLAGIVSCDDNLAQLGIDLAIERTRRHDIIRVAVGTSPTGLRLIREHKLAASTFQSDQADGALPITVAIDWFNGLTVEPIHYLPKHVITLEDVDEFARQSWHTGHADMDVDALSQAIAQCREDGVTQFFDWTYRRLAQARVVSLEYFRGFSIEAVSAIIHILKVNGLSEREFFGTYENLFKSLVRRVTIEDTMDWLRRKSLEAIRQLREKEALQRPIQSIVEYVNQHYAQPISLKVLAERFGMSRSHLGKRFAAETGRPFNRYLTELRISRACDLCRSTPLRATEIALRVGYSDPNYFFTVFKKITGMHPADYRRG